MPVGFPSVPKRVARYSDHRSSSASFAQKAARSEPFLTKASEQTLAIVDMVFYQRARILETLQSGSWLTAWYNALHQPRV